MQLPLDNIDSPYFLQIYLVKIINSVEEEETMKQIRVFIGVLLFSIFSLTKSVLAHNGTDDQSSTIDVFDLWNFILAGVLVVI